MKGSSVQAAVEDARARLKSASDAVENASIANGDTQELPLAKHTRMVGSRHTYTNRPFSGHWSNSLPLVYHGEIRITLSAVRCGAVRCSAVQCSAAYDVLWVHEVQHALVTQQLSAASFGRGHGCAHSSIPVGTSRWTSGE